MSEEKKQVENTEKEPHKPLRDAKGRLLPGQCGNPKGRGKGGVNYKQRFKNLMEEFSSWKAPDAIIKQIKNAIPAMPDNATVEMMEAARVHLAAMMGESWAFDRLHDRPGQAVELSGKMKITDGSNLNDLTDKELLDRLRDIDSRLEIVTGTNLPECAGKAGDRESPLPA